MVEKKQRNMLREVKRYRSRQRNSGLERRKNGNRMSFQQMFKQFIE